MKFNNIEEVLSYLNSLGMFRMQPGQDRMEKALKKLALLPLPFPAFQVVGTNGKGSTSTFLSYIACEHGLKTGLYTSPHFVSPKERILLNNQEIENSHWVACANKVYEAGKDLTYFEFLTVLSVLLFKEVKADFVIFEAGLGGKFDATTALECPVTLFTPIDLDHTHILGNTIEEIASDKAQALQKFSKIAISNMQPVQAEQVLKKQASSLNIPLYFVSQPLANLQDLGLKGPHQIHNASLALLTWEKCAEAFLGIKPQASKNFEALKKTFISGRMQYLSLKTQNSEHLSLIADGGHNAHGLIALRNALYAEEIKPSALIFSCMADKDLTNILPLLKEIAVFGNNCPVFIPKISDNPRAAEPEILVQLLHEVGIQATAFPHISQALEAAIPTCKNSDYPLLLCGSLYLLADFYSMFPEFLFPNP